jgi:AcrR family transcriptional regulator
VTDSEERDGRAERGEATRGALLRAGRELFGKRGYANVGTNELVERAGVTRGAMYHHFSGKRDLFRAVYEYAEQEVLAMTTARMQATDDPWEFLVEGMRSFFDACTDPELRQIGLVDGPAVLGWQEWREIGTRYALGLTAAGLQNAMDAGVLRQADVQQLSHLVMGALGEAGMLLASADDPAAAREDVERTLLTLFEGLRA